MFGNDLSVWRRLTSGLLQELDDDTNRSLCAEAAAMSGFVLIGSSPDLGIEILAVASRNKRSRRHLHTAVPDIVRSGLKFK